jgi:glycosyltransferase involved in cell wall biosynthesis
VTPAIVYDGLRLLLGALTHTPRGVDRVDLSYARYLFENWPGECLGLLPTPWGVRLYDRNKALRMLDCVRSSWRENLAAGTDPALTSFHHWLDRKSAGPQEYTRHRRSNTVENGLRFLRHNGLHMGDSAVRAAPNNAIYLNIGQLGWAAPVTTHWLRRRPDLRAIFMLHDVIPLQHPELVSEGGRLAQDWMLRSVIRRASGLITTTQAATRKVMATLRQHGLPEIPLCSQHLPVSEVFLHNEPPNEALRQQPYFVICGTIEPRKNHLLLLKVWSRLVQRVGHAAPRLVIVGSPGYQGQQILRQFQQAPALRNHVVVLSGMASPSLRHVMANAQAVLTPSLAEGFGLPLIEALTIGTPVLASDLPTHREVGGDLAIYLDPSDDVAWFDAIMSIVEDDTETAMLRQRIGCYRPVTASDYFGSMGAFLAEFS